MSVLIVGASGNMGSRYKSVLTYLGKRYLEADVGTPSETVHKMAKYASGILICTPTSTHTKIMQDLSIHKKPILVEKPVSKNIGELKTALDICEKNKAPVRMVYQYSLLARSQSKRGTLYNYFKHGSDGLIWDCIQPISLARGRILLGEESPIWKCIINGHELSLSQMDQAYVDYVNLWMKEPGQDPGEIISAHEKCAEMSSDYKEEMN